MRSSTLTRALALLVLLSGCTCLDRDYVAADRLTHDAIAPEYRRYVELDAALDEEQKARRERTLVAWEARIEAAQRRTTEQDEAP